MCQCMQTQRMGILGFFPRDCPRTSVYTRGCIEFLYAGSYFEHLCPSLSGWESLGQHGRQKPTSTVFKSKINLKAHKLHESAFNAFCKNVKTSQTGLQMAEFGSPDRHSGSGCKTFFFLCHSKKVSHKFKTWVGHCIYVCTNEKTSQLRKSDAFSRVAASFCH